MAEPVTSSLGSRTLRGVAWSYASLAGVRLLVLASTAVLARLLTPHEFGLVALALIFTAVFDALRDLGLNQALIVAKRQDLDREAETAFRFSLAIGLLLAAVVAAISPLAADFFHQPQLLALLAVLGINLPLRALGLTHYALAQRNLDFRSRTVAEVAEVVVRGGVGIGFAVAGKGPWSLVLGYLAGTLAWSFALWLLVSWRPSLHAPRGRISTLIRFGGPLTVISLIGVGMSYVDNLFVGRVLGATALGTYALGYRVPEMVIVEIVSAVGLVLFPAFAQLDGAGLRRALIATSRYSMLLMLPLAAALFVLAGPVVAALFGPRWHAAVPVVRILSVGFMGGPLGQVSGNAFLATKRVGVMLWLAVPQGILLVTLLAIFVHRGIAAVAACQAGTRLLFAAIALVVAIRVFDLSPRALWQASLPAIVGTAGMVAVIVPLERAIHSPWPALLACSLLGGAVYLGLVWLFARDSLRALWAMARPRASV
jgi:O-antigen/teichoic acid export membrane protein